MFVSVGRFNGAIFLRGAKRQAASGKRRSKLTDEPTREGRSRREAQHFGDSSFAARIGVDEVLGIDPQVINGVYSGASFYSDSRNDLPLLKRVDFLHVVNPDAVLREQAEQNGWLVHSWK